MHRRRFLIGSGVALAGAGAILGEVGRMGSMDEYTASVSAARVPLAARPEFADLIRFATLAPNGHNTQPWRFRIDDNRIEILPDFTRRTPVVDPDDHHVFVSLGCAAENLSLASAARNRPGVVRVNPANEGSVVFTAGGGAVAEPALFEAIRHRQSTRADYDGRPVGVDELRTLAAAAAMPGVDVVLLTERTQMDHVRDLIVAGNTEQIADAAFVRELKSWLRFSPRHALESGDGLFSAASGSPILPEWLGPHLFDMVYRVGPENDRYARQLRTSAGVAVFVSERADIDHWVRAGRACQRFALQATALGLRHAFVNQPVEVAHLRPELAALVGMSGRRPDIVMRFGYGPTTPYSARRAAVIVA